MFNNLRGSDSAVHMDKYAIVIYRIQEKNDFKKLKTVIIGILKTKT